MQEFAPKKDEKKVQEPVKKNFLRVPDMLLSTEGPIKALQESKKVEQMGRESFEKSVKIELEAIKKKAKKKKPSRRAKKAKEK
ncbi:MAG: hypothetical protein N3G80_01735 [Candidatus Micrarchaeota archaeon]|nr:hypothetical protein [Candidatus Micrarchaeota archaeon]